MSGLVTAAVNSSLNQTSDTNGTDGNGSAPCSHVDTSAQLVFMLVCSLLFLVGLVLNSFTLRVYFCRAQQQASSSVTVYLKNLAAADFLLSLCLPLRIANHASNSITVRRAYCHFGASAFYLNMYASILFMGYIAANRYLKIVHPLGTHILQRVRAAHIISMVTWASLLVSTGFYITLSLLTQPPLTSIPASGSCSALHSRQVMLLYKTIHCCSAAVFFFVLVSLIFFYYSTSRRLMLVQQRQPGVSVASSGSRKLAKSRRNMLVLVSVFCICFVPYHLVRLPYAFMGENCAWSWLFFYLKELTVTLSVLNICLDPLIYFIFCKAFRAQMNLKRMFSTTHAMTQAPGEERRTSEGRLSIAKIDKKASFSMVERQTGVL